MPTGRLVGPAAKLPARGAAGSGEEVAPGQGLRAAHGRDRQRPLRARGDDPLRARAQRGPGGQPPRRARGGQAPGTDRPGQRRPGRAHEGARLPPERRTRPAGGRSPSTPRPAKRCCRCWRRRSRCERGSASTWRACARSGPAAALRGELLEISDRLARVAEAERAARARPALLAAHPRRRREPRLPARVQQPDPSRPRAARPQPALARTGAQARRLPPADRRGDRRRRPRGRRRGGPPGAHAHPRRSSSLDRPTSAGGATDELRAGSRPATTARSPPRAPISPALGACWREFFEHFSPRAVLAAIALALGARIYVGEWSWRDLLPPLALLAAQPFVEWVIHKYLLHLPPHAAARPPGRAVRLDPAPQPPPRPLRPRPGAAQADRGHQLPRPDRRS